MAKELTREYLKECLDYNQDTEVFIWKERPLNHFSNSIGFNTFNSTHKGRIAGCLNKDGDRVIKIDYIQYTTSFLKCIFLNIKPKSRSDIAKNASKNRKESCIRKDNVTGYKGVKYKKNTGKFEANISIDGKQKYIGTFLSAYDASIAYLSEKQKQVNRYG